MTPPRFLIGSTVSIPANTTLAVVVVDPASPGDRVAVIELREGTGSSPGPPGRRLQTARTQASDQRKQSAVQLVSRAGSGPPASTHHVPVLSR